MRRRTYGTSANNPSAMPNNCLRNRTPHIKGWFMRWVEKVIAAHKHSLIEGFLTDEPR